MYTKNQKVVLLIFQTPDYGGTRSFFYQLIDYLQNRNYQVFLLVKKSEFTEKVSAYCKNNNINTYVFNKKNLQDVYLTSFWPVKISFLKTYNYIKQILYLRNLYKKVKPELTIISQGWPFVWFRGLYIPGKIYFFQHVMPLHPLDKGNKLLLKIGLLHQRCTFVPVSDFCLNKMRQYWIGNYSNAVTVHNFYEKQLNNSTTQQLNNSTTLTVIALARVEDGKNPLVWIELAKEILKLRQNIRFLWAGSGSLVERCRKETENNENISFIGFQKDVSELYNKADIYFVPSKRESHGISEVGAMAHSLPVIATSNGGTVESILDGHNGFIVDVTDEEQMIDRLLNLIDSEELRLKMGKNSKKRWEALFTKEIWEQKLNNLLNI